MGKLKMDGLWWKKDERDVAQAIHATVENIDDLQTSGQEDALRNARLYGNIDQSGLSAFTYATSTNTPQVSNRLTFNLVKSCIDAACNRISKNKPRAQFLTDGGKWSQQTKAKKMSLFADALFYETGYYEKAQNMFRDGCLFDIGGWMKIGSMNGSIFCERVMPHEIKLDDIDAYYGEPQSIYQVKYYSRESLLDAFPKKKNEILNAPVAQDVALGVKQIATEMIRVVEAWKLPIGKGEHMKLGRHTIALESAALVDEEWVRPHFPFVCFQWTKPVFGFRGISLATELTPIQVELNRTLKTIQQIIRLTVPKLFIEKGAKVVTSHLNNDIGGIIEFTGTRPMYDALQAVPADLLNHVDRLIARGYEQAGISSLYAASQKPAGLDSGRALREFTDIESERFALAQQYYENCAMDAAKLMLAEVAAMSEAGQRVSLRVIDKRSMSRLDWKAIKLDDQDYIMQPYPTSFLSKTPAGRLQNVQELLQAGFIDKNMGLKLLDFPDIESAMNLMNSAVDDISMIIQRMIEEGEYQPPEDYQNLQLVIQMTQSAYFKAKVDGVPEERLELLRRYMDEAAIMLQPPPPPEDLSAPISTPMEMPVDEAGVPLGVPEQAPVSDMLPLPTASL